jgi:hypothetical protein
MGAVAALSRSGNRVDRTFMETVVNTRADRGRDVGCSANQSVWQNPWSDTYLAGRTSTTPIIPASS